MSPRPALLAAALCAAFLSSGCASSLDKPAPLVAMDLLPKPSAESAARLQVFSRAMSSNPGQWRDRSLERRAIGQVFLPTGRIVACDPFVSPDKVTPYTQPVPPGLYAVDLIITRAKDGDERIAFAVVSFNPGPVSNWRLAVPEDSDPGSASESACGYSVTSGHGAFVDLSARPYFKDYQYDHPMYRLINEGNQRTYRHTCSWAIVPLDPTTGASIATFASGDGNGRYSSYWGFDDRGNLLCLVTDFVEFKN